MSFLTKIRERRTRNLERAIRQAGWIKAAEVYPNWLLATAEAARWDIPDGTEWENQVDLYRTLSWVNIAVTAISNEVATARFEVQRREGDRLQEIPNHPLEQLLDRPNPRDSRFELFFSTVAFRALTGTSYWWLNRQSEDEVPQEIWPVESWRVRPVPDGRMFIKHYEYTPGQGMAKKKLPPWQMIQFRRFHPRSPFIGLSPIEAISTVAVGDQKMQEWLTNFFALRHAKMSGILAFKDSVGKTEWEKLKKQVRDEYGGTKRRMMMLQGVGEGGVDWVSTNISQRDMEFLAARRFNKEEILAIYAPGLASLLDVGATEANANTGLRTFRNHVYTQMQAIAQTVVNRLLRVYGEGLTASFDDIRITDRSLELREIRQYATAHTIDEIRARFYSDPPLGDERGSMFVAEFGGRFPPAGGSSRQAQAQRQEQSPGKAELKTWQRYAGKRDGTKAAQFKCEHVQTDLERVIKARLRAATTNEEVRAAFTGPF